MVSAEKKISKINTQLWTSGLRKNHFTAFKLQWTEWTICNAKKTCFDLLHATNQQLKVYATDMLRVNVVYNDIFVLYNLMVGYMIWRNKNLS